MNDGVMSGSLAYRAEMFQDLTITLDEDVHVRHQSWEMQGMKGESLIFMEHDIAHLSDDELLDQIYDSPFNTTKGGLTLLRDEEGFTFINLNIKY